MNWIELEDLNEKSLNKALQLVYQFTGISMNINKKNLLQGRLRSRIRVLGLGSYEQYLDYLMSHKEEVPFFVSEVTTNETYFFRTQRVWNYFNHEFLPGWIKNNQGKVLKIWSGAASTGEEASTIGICCEEFRRKNPLFDYQILGTDISQDVLKFAERGLYTGRSIELLKTARPEMLEKYLLEVQDGYVLRNEIRSRIKFMQHNLFNLPEQIKDYDIVFLRNVLIYFTQPDQEKVLNNLSKAMKANSLLIIGESESLSSLNIPFSYVQPLIYKKFKEI